jgi:hypothetical protein
MGAAGVSTFVPQFRQNLLPFGSVAPQDVQTGAASGSTGSVFAPHLLQTTSPFSYSAPQLMHLFMGSLALFYFLTTCFIPSCVFRRFFLY